MRAHIAGARKTAVAGAEPLRGIRVALRPITSETARVLGVEVTAQARELTIAGLVEAVRQPMRAQIAGARKTAVAGTEPLRGIRVASTAPIGSETARGLGVEVTAQAREFTIAGLVEAVGEIL
jgi:uroporphyrinogen-III synthase